MFMVVIFFLNKIPNVYKQSSFSASVPQSLHVYLEQAHPTGEWGCHPDRQLKYHEGKSEVVMTRKQIKTELSVMVPAGQEERVSLSL